jgi:hypothetical protein
VQNGSIPLATVYALFNDPDTLERLGLPALGMGILSPNLFLGSRCIQRGVDSVSLGDGSTLPKVPSLEGNGDDECDEIFPLPRTFDDEPGPAIEYPDTLCRRHREFRNSVIVASKNFDQKQNARTIAKILRQRRILRPSKNGQPGFEAWCVSSSAVWHDRNLYRIISIEILGVELIAFGLALELMLKRRERATMLLG